MSEQSAPDVKRWSLTDWRWLLGLAVCLALGGAGAYVVIAGRSTGTTVTCRADGVISAAPEAARSGRTPEDAIRATIEADRINSPARDLERVAVVGAEERWIDRDEGREYNVSPKGDGYTVTMYGNACDAARRR